MFARAASRVVGAGMGLLALGAASFSSSASTSEADPFDDPQLTAALPRRGESEVKLRSYLAAQRQAVQTMLLEGEVLAPPTLLGLGSGLAVPRRGPLRAAPSAGTVVQPPKRLRRPSQRLERRQPKQQRRRRP